MTSDLLTVAVGHMSAFEKPVSQLVSGQFPAEGPGLSGSRELPLYLQKVVCHHEVTP